MLCYDCNKVSEVNILLQQHRALQIHRELFVNWPLRICELFGRFIKNYLGDLAAFM